MLVHEAEDTLHLLPAVPDGWLAPGKTIRVDGAPTHFGSVSFRVEGTAAGVDVDVEPPRRNPPARVLLHLPASKQPRGVPEGVEVVARPEQKTAWSLAHVIELYGSAPPSRPIPGLVKLPLASPAPEDRWKALDLRAAATANPFTAPFGVENPGRFLFTGMRTGRQRASGVPFEIIDPRENAGKGIVVLEGHGGSAEFPRQVSVPVGAQGKRLFFLGNVHGWRPADEGVGEWNALAEYAIQYADGSEQVVPLIAGRTTDDWASTPELVDLPVGLEGDPWHLNVLGVELRPLTVKQIIFRDLGTPSAPVLVAVTMEVEN
jgi:hypothetical protein